MNDLQKSNKLTFFKSFVGFSLSSWVNAGLSLISTPVITRVFETSELGKIQLFISIVNIFLNFAYLGIDQAFTRFYHEPPGKNDKKSFLCLCLTLTSVVALFVMLGILGFGKWFSETIIGYVTFIVPVSMIISIVANIVMRFFNLASRMEKNILWFNIQAITITVISNISYVAVAFYKPNAESAIIFRTALTFLAALVFLLAALKKSISFKMDMSRNVIKDVLLYALPLCPATVLSVANNSIGQILLKHYVDYSSIGIYSNAVTVAAIITIIQSGMNSYWPPFVFENYKTKQREIIKMHHMISFVIIIFGLFVILCQDLIYLILIGKNFRASKQIFPLLAISPICYTISETLGVGIRLSKRTGLNIPVYLINVIVNLGLCIILLPKIGVIGAAVASAASSIAMLIAKSIFGERAYRCSDNYLKLILALLTLVMTAVIHIFIYESMVKYLVYIIAIAIVTFLYREEVKLSLKLLTEIKNKIFKKI